MESKYNPRYEEMDTRNREWLSKNSPIYDPLLVSEDAYSDKRRSLALIAHPDSDTRFTSHWFSLIGQLLTNIDSKLFVKPLFHQTFLVTSPWIDGTTQTEHENLRAKVDLMNITMPAIKPYDITFDRLIPTKTGLVMCGIPSRCLDDDRNALRAAGLCGELYHLDIVHSSILRWTAPVPPKEVEAMLAICDSFKKPDTIFATMRVNELLHTEASWLMYNYRVLG